VSDRSLNASTGAARQVVVVSLVALTHSSILHASSLLSNLVADRRPGLIFEINIRERLPGAILRERGDCDECQYEISASRRRKSLQRGDYDPGCDRRTWPGQMAPRTDLGWQFDHFIGYFGITLFVCLAWPRPFVVGGVIMAVAALLEALQALTQIDGAGGASGRWGIHDASISDSLRLVCGRHLLIDRCIRMGIQSANRVARWRQSG
jgi:hypothetical protein